MINRGRPNAKGRQNDCVVVEKSRGIPVLGLVREALGGQRPQLLFAKALEPGFGGPASGSNDAVE